MYEKIVNRGKQNCVWGAEHRLSLLSLSKGESFLKHAGFMTCGMLPDMYELFWIEPLPSPSSLCIKIASEDHNSVLIT